MNIISDLLSLRKACSAGWKSSRGCKEEVQEHLSMRGSFHQSSELLRDGDSGRHITSAMIATQFTSKNLK